MEIGNINADILRTAVSSLYPARSIPVFSEQQRRYDDTEALLDLKKRNRISMEVVPDVLSHMAWAYADKVFAYASENRIAKAAKLTRVSRECRQEYRAMLIKRVGLSSARKNWEILNNIMLDMNANLSILWFTVNGEFKKQHPDIIYDTMCTDAIIAMLLIEELKKHIASIRKTIHGNGIDKDVYMSKHLTNLYDIMTGYLQNLTIERTDLIDRGLLIVTNEIKHLQFEE